MLKWIAFGLIAGIQMTGASSVLAKNPTREPVIQRKADKGDDGPYSPLHDFLGIDPKTGRFESDSQSSVPGSQNPSSDQARESSDTSDRTAPIDRERQINREQQIAQDAAEAFKGAADSIREGSFDDLGDLFGQSLKGNGLLRLHRRLVWITVLVAMLYPISILLSEAVSYFINRDNTHWNHVDRQFERRRRTARLALAGVYAALLALMGLTAGDGLWFEQPWRIGLILAAAAGFSITAIVISGWIRQANRSYQLELIRDIRKEQLELRAEWDELKERLKAGESA